MNFLVGFLWAGITFIVVSIANKIKNKYKKKYRAQEYFCNVFPNVAQHIMAVYFEHVKEECVFSILENHVVLRVYMDGDYVTFKKCINVSDWGSSVGYARSCMTESYVFSLMKSYADYKEIAYNTGK